MLKFIIRACAVTFTTILVIAICLYIFTMRSRQDLKIWHTTHLDKEVTAADIKKMSSLQEYIERENKLFDQLNEQIYNRTPEKHSLKLNRYLKGSWCNPHRFKQNWNRTIDLPPRSQRLVS